MPKCVSLLVYKLGVYISELAASSLLDTTEYGRHIEAVI